MLDLDILESALCHSGLYVIEALMGRKEVNGSAAWDR